LVPIFVGIPKLDVEIIMDAIQSMLPEILDIFTGIDTGQWVIEDAGIIDVMNDAKSFLTLIVSDPQTKPSGTQAISLGTYIPFGGLPGFGMPVGSINLNLPFGTGGFGTSVNSGVLNTQIIGTRMNQNLGPFFGTSPNVGVLNNSFSFGGVGTFWQTGTIGMPANLGNFGSLGGIAGSNLFLGTPAMGSIFGSSGYNKAFMLPGIGASPFNLGNVNQTFGFAAYNMPSNFSNSVFIFGLN